MLRSNAFAEMSRTLWDCCSLYAETLDFLRSSCLPRLHKVGIVISYHELVL